MKQPQTVLSITGFRKLLNNQHWTCFLTRLTQMSQKLDETTWNNLANIQLFDKSNDRTVGFPFVDAGMRELAVTWACLVTVTFFRVPESKMAAIFVKSVCFVLQWELCIMYWLIGCYNRNVHVWVILLLKQANWMARSKRLQYQGDRLHEPPPPAMLRSIPSHFFSDKRVWWMKLNHQKWSWKKFSQICKGYKILKIPFLFLVVHLYWPGLAWPIFWGDLFWSVGSVGSVSGPRLGTRLAHGCGAFRASWPRHGSWRWHHQQQVNGDIWMFNLSRLTEFCSEVPIKIYASKFHVLNLVFKRSAPVKATTGPTIWLPKGHDWFLLSTFWRIACFFLALKAWCTHLDVSNTKTLRVLGKVAIVRPYPWCELGQLGLSPLGRKLFNSCVWLILVGWKPGRYSSATLLGGKPSEVSIGGTHQHGGGRWKAGRVETSLIQIHGDTRHCSFCWKIALQLSRCLRTAEHTREWSTLWFTKSPFTVCFCLPPM